MIIPILTRYWGGRVGAPISRQFCWYLPVILAPFSQLLIYYLSCIHIYMYFSSQQKPRNNLEPLPYFHNKTNVLHVCLNSKNQDSMHLIMEDIVNFLKLFCFQFGCHYLKWFVLQTCHMICHDWPWNDPIDHALFYFAFFTERPRLFLILVTWRLHNPRILPTPVSHSSIMHTLPSNNT